MPRRFSITAVLIILSLLAGCQPAAKDTGMPINPSDTVKVLVSILPQADFVKSIGGSRVEVTVLIPPGASPEDYEMSPRQIQKISEADIYFTVGSIPFEKMEEIKPIKNMAKIRMCIFLLKKENLIVQGNALHASTINNNCATRC